MNENIPLNIDNNVEVSAGFPKMNLIQRIIGVIFSPGKVMQSLEQKPRILFALLLTIITPLVMIFSVYPMYKEYLRSTLETAPATANLTAEQIDMAVNISQYSTPFILAITAVAMWVLGALVLWVIFKIFKGVGRYKQILSVTGYAAVIAALATIASIITTQITGVFSDVAFTSLASFFLNMKGSFIYGVAKTIEIFSIWQYVVIAIGVATVSKLDKKKVYIIVACIFAVIAIYTGVMEVRAAV